MCTEEFMWDTCKTCGVCQHRYAYSDGNWSKRKCRQCTGPGTLLPKEFKLPRWTFSNNTFSWRLARKFGCGPGARKRGQVVGIASGMPFAGHAPVNLDNRETGLVVYTNREWQLPATSDDPILEMIAWFYFSKDEGCTSSVLR